MLRQYDLCQTRSGALVLILQSDQLESLQTRVFAPCRAKVGTVGGGRIAPVFWFGDREYQVILSQLGTARLADMGGHVGNLSHLREEIVRGLDLLLTGV